MVILIKFFSIFINHQITYIEVVMLTVKEIIQKLAIQQLVAFSFQTSLNTIILN